MSNVENEDRIRLKYLYPFTRQFVKKFTAYFEECREGNAAGGLAQPGSKTAILGGLNAGEFGIEVPVGKLIQVPFRVMRTTQAQAATLAFGWDHVDRRDVTLMKLVLMQVGIDIFYHFEAQFTEISEDSWQRSKDLLVQDIVKRIVSFGLDNPEKIRPDMSESEYKMALLEGVVRGKADTGVVVKRRSHFNHPWISHGHDIAGSSEETWNTSKLLSKTGIVDMREENKKFYRRPSQKKKYDKFGFRRAFPFEEDTLEMTYTRQNNQDRQSSHTYVLNKNLLQVAKDDLQKEYFDGTTYNCQRPKPMFDRSDLESWHQKIDDELKSTMTRSLIVTGGFDMNEVVISYAIKKQVETYYHIAAVNCAPEQGRMAREVEDLCFELQYTGFPSDRSSVDKLTRFLKFHAEKLRLKMERCLIVLIDCPLDTVQLVVSTGCTNDYMSIIFTSLTVPDTDQVPEVPVLKAEPYNSESNDSVNLAMAMLGLQAEDVASKEEYEKYLQDLVKLLDYDPAKIKSVTEAASLAMDKAQGNPMKILKDHVDNLRASLPSDGLSATSQPVAVVGWPSVTRLKLASQGLEEEAMVTLYLIASSEVGQIPARVVTGMFNPRPPSEDIEILGNAKWIAVHRTVSDVETISLVLAARYRTSILEYFDTMKRNIRKRAVEVGVCHLFALHTAVTFDEANGGQRKALRQFAKELRQQRRRGQGMGDGSRGATDNPGADFYDCFCMLFLDTVARCECNGVARLHADNTTANQTPMAQVN